MKSPLILAAGLALLAPVAAYATDSTATPPATGKPAADPNRQICKSEEVPGSLIQKKKICMSAHEWKERAMRDGQWTEHMAISDSGKSN